MAGKKKKPSYEGGQYRGGRKKGTPNLKKTASGNLVNQYGVQFTPEERKALQNAVNTANRKRSRMLKDAATMPRKIGGRDTGDTVGSLQLMGKESDFILARKSKSLQRFRSREDYNRYMKNLERVNSRNYIDDRTLAYRDNYMKALENAFGDDAKDVIMKVSMMKPKEYRKLVEQDELMEISYVYDPSARSGKLNQIRASLGMEMKEEEIDE